MEKIDFDGLYLSASSGNKESYRKLYLWFQNLGQNLADDCANANGVYFYNKDDLSFYIAEIFIQALRMFELGKIPFSRYAEYVLKKRIPRFLGRVALNKNEKALSLDSLDEDGIPYLEKIESDDYSAMLSIIEKNESEQIIASQRQFSQSVNKNLQKYLTLREAGLKKSAIIKCLNITDGQYRYLKRNVKNLLTGPIEMK